MFSYLLEFCFWLGARVLPLCVLLCCASLNLARSCPVYPTIYRVPRRWELMNDLICVSRVCAKLDGIGRRRGGVVFFCGNIAGR